MVSGDQKYTNLYYSVVKLAKKTGLIDLARNSPLTIHCVVRWLSLFRFSILIFAINEN